MGIMHATDGAKPTLLVKNGICPGSFRENVEQSFETELQLIVEDRVKVGMMKKDALPFSPHKWRDVQEFNHSLQYLG